MYTVTCVEISWTLKCPHFWATVISSHLKCKVCCSTSLSFPPFGEFWRRLSELRGKKGNVKTEVCSAAQKQHRFFLVTVMMVLGQIHSANCLILNPCAKALMLVELGWKCTRRNGGYRGNHSGNHRGRRGNKSKRGNKSGNARLPSEKCIPSVGGYWKTHAFGCNKYSQWNFGVTAEFRCNNHAWLSRVIFSANPFWPPRIDANFLRRTSKLAAPHRIDYAHVPRYPGDNTRERMIIRSACNCHSEPQFSTSLLVFIASQQQLLSCFDSRPPTKTPYSLWGVALLHRLQL